MKILVRKNHTESFRQCLDDMLCAAGITAAHMLFDKFLLIT